MILNTSIGKVIAATPDSNTGYNPVTASSPVYEICSIPYAKADRFSYPTMMEYPKGNSKIINSEQTFCFPQRKYPLALNFLLRHPMMRKEFVPNEDIQSEEALVVNIWTDSEYSPKGFEDAKKPVLVFIHGGGEGSGTVPIYKMNGIAKHGIVAVSITYRVGNFGYMPTFEGSRMTASLAYRDQQAALIWIQKHIGAFGGNPKDVDIAAADWQHWHILYTRRAMPVFKNLSCVRQISPCLQIRKR